MRPKVMIFSLWFLATTSTLAAQQPPRFQFQTGQILVYQVEQSTEIVEVLPQEDQPEPLKLTSTARLALTKYWTVDQVTDDGVATLTMSVQAIRMEHQQPGEEPLVFDSTDSNAQQPEMKQQVATYLGKPLTRIRLDPRGRLVEVLESKFGPGSRLTADLPFRVVWPEQALAKGMSWNRNYAIRLDPPLGAGESYPATQTYTLQNSRDASIVIDLLTQLPRQPEIVTERIPLLPLQPKGRITFDRKHGRYTGCDLKVKRELDHHQGQGSRYHFQTHLVERLTEVR